MWLNIPPLSTLGYWRRCETSTCARSGHRLPRNLFPIHMRETSCPWHLSSSPPIILKGIKHTNIYHVHCPFPPLLEAVAFEQQHVPNTRFPGLKFVPFAPCRPGFSRARFIKTNFFSIFAWNENATLRSLARKVKCNWLF